MPLHTLAEIVEITTHSLQLLRDKPRVMQKHCSCRSDPHPPAVPFQERSIESIFHGTDTLTRRRQGHVRAGRPMRDATGFGNMHE